MYIYSTQIMAWSSVATPPAYEVPTGYVLIVRDADVTTGGGSLINFAMGIAADLAFWRGAFTVEDVGQNQQWRGRQILQAGQALYFAGDGATSGVVSGYLLADVAP